MSFFENIKLVRLGLKQSGSLQLKRFNTYMSVHWREVFKKTGVVICGYLICASSFVLLDIQRTHPSQSKQDITLYHKKNYEAFLEPQKIQTDGVYDSNFRAISKVLKEASGHGDYLVLNTASNMVMVSNLISFSISENVRELSVMNVKTIKIDSPRSKKALASGAASQLQKPMARDEDPQTLDIHDSGKAKPQKESQEKLALNKAVEDRSQIGITTNLQHGFELMTGMSLLGGLELETSRAQYQKLPIEAKKSYESYMSQVTLDTVYQKFQNGLLWGWLFTLPIIYLISIALTKGNLILRNAIARWRVLGQGVQEEQQNDQALKVKTHLTDTIKSSIKKKSSITTPKQKV